MQRLDVDQIRSEAAFRLIGVHVGFWLFVAGHETDFGRRQCAARNGFFYPAAKNFLTNRPPATSAGTDLVDFIGRQRLDNTR